MKRPRGWPKTRSQDSARARAMIDDEVLRRFYWGCSAACRDNQYESDPWHLWALSPLRSHFYYYLFTYSNNVGVISAAINLQPWLVNSELCNKKKRGCQLITTTMLRIFTACLCSLELFYTSEGKKTYGNMWTHILTVAVLCWSSWLVKW